MQLIMFSKMLGSLSVEETGDAIAEMGFEGVDLTVREGGHVLPERVETDLPRAVETLRTRGLSVPMITTGVVDAQEPCAEAVFRTASQCGIRYLKPGYWQYGGFGHIRAQIKAAREKLVGLETLAKRYDVCVGLHTHSGDFITALPGTLLMLLEGFDPKHVGAYIDPGHMALEGARSGWEIGMDLLAERIVLVAVKDVGWTYRGGKDWQPNLFPLSEGMVKWPQVFAHLGTIGYDGVLTVHSEYPQLSTEALIAQTKRDLAYLREVMGG